ncbi:MAG: gamma-glutamyl-gamma-aminobutyrate hydrolase family protein [bacterium]
MRIGITTYGRDPEGRLTLPAEYVACVRAARGRVVLLPPGESDPAAWLEDLDGIVLAGGGDLAPETWGGTGTAENYGVDLDRDRTELALAAAVLDRHLPSLWICRGLQILNVVLGGTLIEHLPDRVGEEVLHRLPPREPVSHPVELEPASRLARSLGCTRCDTVSWHHQAVDRPGSQLVVVARAPDGTIEALELPSHPELVAVQWHPELSAAEDPVQQGLFDALVVRAHG